MVRDTDGSAFITKAEFDSLKNNFQAQLDSYNANIDSKIDSAIASYLSGISISRTVTQTCLLGRYYSKLESYGKDYKHNPNEIIGILTLQYQIMRGYIVNDPSTARDGKLFDNKIVSTTTPTYGWTNLFSVLDKNSDGTYNFGGRKYITWKGSVDAVNYHSQNINPAYMGAIAASSGWTPAPADWATAIGKKPIKTFSFANLPQNKHEYANPSYWSTRTSTGALNLSDGNLFDWVDFNTPERAGWILLGFTTANNSMPMQVGVANITIFQNDAETNKNAIMFYKDNTDVNEPFSTSDILPTVSYTLPNTKSFTKLANSKWSFARFLFYKLKPSGSGLTFSSITTAPTETFTSSADPYQIGDPLLPECYDVDVNKIVYNDFTTIKKDGISESDTNTSNNVGRFALNVGLPIFKVSSDGVLKIPFSFDSAANKTYKIWLKHGPFPVDKTTIAKSGCLAPKSTATQNADGSFNLTFNAANDPISLNFDVKKDDLIYIYFTEDGKQGGGVFNIPKSCDLTTTD